MGETGGRSLARLGSMMKNVITVWRRGGRGAALAATITITVVLYAAYAGSMNAPFVYDDEMNIITNRTIRSFWSAWNVQKAPHLSSVTGRPVVNLTFAVNYALSGLNPWSYHALNLFIHILAGLLLYGIVRRTLLTQHMRNQFGRDAAPLGLACALIWALHPVQTHAVTYISQRCESLMGLFFLLTIYCALRGWVRGPNSRAGIAWSVGAVAAFLCGTGTKEVIAVAPILIFAYDLVFIRRRAIDSIRNSKLLYAGLAAGLVLQAIFVLTSGRVEASMQDKTITMGVYTLSQAKVILHYIYIMFWPVSQNFDYSWPIPTIGQTLLWLCALGPFVATTAWALVRRRPEGYAGFWFFAVLAPTSLTPMVDVIVEYRIYVALAGPVTLTVLTVYNISCSVLDMPGKPDGAVAVLGLCALVMSSLILGTLTWNRNLDYRSDLALWSDSVDKTPDNPRALTNMGKALARRGRHAEALVLHRRALAIKSNYTTAMFNLGNALLNTGRLDEAEREYRRVLKLTPDVSGAHANLGVILARTDRPFEAVKHLERAIALEQDTAEMHANLSLALHQSGDIRRALIHLDRSLDMQPDNPRLRTFRDNLEKRQSSKALD